MKYTKTTNNVATFKPVIISNKVKKVVEDIMKDKFQIDDFNQLNIQEKRIVNKLADFLGMTAGEDTSDEFQKQFDILLGQVQSGNDSNIIKAKLKQMILVAINEKRIPRTEGYKQILELSL